MNLLRWFMERRLTSMEEELGTSLSYLKNMSRISMAHCRKFMKVMPLARFRTTLAPDAYHLARIVTARLEGCGACLHMEVHLAKQAGVDAPDIQAAIEGNPCALSPDLAEVYFFAEAVITRNGTEDEFREAILRRHDEIGLIEISLAIAVCQMFPTVKRALGYVVPCVSSNSNFGALDR